MKFASFKQLSLDNTWDAIVIGSGIGGLATAALLSSYAHKRVLVLERHYVAGGYTHVFHRPGYEWDVGLHYIGAVQNEESTVRRGFDLITDAQLKWAPMPDIYDRFVIGERTYDFPTGVERFRDRMKDYFPQDGAAIDKYIAAVQAVHKATEPFFAEKAIPRPIAYLLGGLMRAPFLRWANRTTADVLRGFTRNDELIGVLAAQWGDYGLPPGQSSFGMHAIVANHYFEGASYPVGGASRIAQTVNSVIERGGGKIVVNAEVAEILQDGQKAVGVRMSDGREFRAGTIISDAGARNTYERLISRTNPALEKLRTEMRAIPPSTAHLCLYVGIKESAADLGISGTNLWIHPTYDHDANAAGAIVGSAYRFPSLYISFPSAKDPDFERRHPGRATIEAVALVPYRRFEQWQETSWRRRGPDYNAFKQELSIRLQYELERHVPAISGKIDYAELSTPLSTRHFMNYERGESYGLSATPKRFRLRCLTPRTPIRNLYLTGQDVVSLGVTGALLGGVVTASVVLRRNLMATLSKPASKRMAVNKANTRAPEKQPAMA
ncbi:MAG: NAD(P)/FAD-dependent oxidoreductase [Verrucomicrobia bacterium]|nr:NAD(P)/FAD-dependent oxidoreductase [Verrucomicrobiota bacterium]